MTSAAVLSRWRQYIYIYVGGGTIDTTHNAGPIMHVAMTAIVKKNAMRSLLRRYDFFTMILKAIIRETEDQLYEVRTSSTFVHVYRASKKKK